MTPQVLDEIQAASQESSKEEEVNSKDANQGFTNSDADVPKNTGTEKTKGDPPVINHTKPPRPTKSENDKKLKKKFNGILTSKKTTKGGDNLGQSPLGSKSCERAVGKQAAEENAETPLSPVEPPIVSSNENGTAVSSKDDGIVADANGRDDVEVVDEEKLSIIDHMLVHS